MKNHMFYKYFLLTLMLPTSIGWSADSYQVAKDGVPVQINEHGSCYTVTNTSAKDIFVPTRTADEWTKFQNASIANVDITACGNDAFTKLLLHFEDTSFTDSSSSAHAVTITGTTRSSVQKKFGTYSAYFNGGQYLTIPSSADWGFGTGEFTIDFWVYLESKQVHDFWCVGTSSTTWSQLHTTANGILIEVGDVGMNGGAYFGGNTLIPTGSWQHQAIVRKNDNGTMKIAYFLNGKNIRTDNHSANAATGLLYIGRKWDNAWNMKGYMDEFRISKGVARFWTDTCTASNWSCFPEPTSAY